MKKINSKIANKLGQKFKETTIEKNEVIEVLDVYIPKLDYNDFDLNEDTQNILIKFEEKVIFHAQELSKNTIELSKIFFQAQQTLSSAKTGTFTKWYEALGFKKDFVYMLLKRNELFIEIGSEKIFSIPEKAIKEISKIKNQATLNELEKVIHSEKPLEAIYTYKNSILSGHPKDKSLNNEILKIEKQITKKYNEIEQLQNKLNQLKDSLK